MDKNALFLEATGGPDKKKRVYGVGSSQDIFYQPQMMPDTLSFASEENQKLQQELVEVKDRVKALEGQIAKLIQANSVPTPETPESPAYSDPAEFNGQTDDGY